MSAGAAALLGGTWLGLRSDNDGKPVDVATPDRSGSPTVEGTHGHRLPEGVQLPDTQSERDAAGGTEFSKPAGMADAAKDVLLRFTSQNFKSHQFAIEPRDGKQMLVATKLVPADRDFSVSVIDPLFDAGNMESARQARLQEKRTDAFVIFKKNGMVNSRSTVEQKTIPSGAYVPAADAAAYAESVVLTPTKDGKRIASVTLSPEEAANLKRALNFDAGQLKADIENTLAAAPAPYRAVIEELKTRRGELDLDFLKTLFLLPPNMMARDDLLAPFQQALAHGDYGAMEYILRHRALPDAAATTPVRDAVGESLLRVLWEKGQYQPPADGPANPPPPGLGDIPHIIRELQLNRHALSYRFFSDVVNNVALTDQNHPEVPQEIRARYEHPWVHQACAEIYSACGLSPDKNGEARYNALLDINARQMEMLRKLSTRDASIPLQEGTPDYGAVTKNLEAQAPKADFSVTKRNELEFIARHAPALIGPNGLINDTSDHNFLATFGLIETLDTLQSSPAAKNILHGNTLLCDVSSGGLEQLGELARAASLDNSDLALSGQPVGLTLARYRAYNVPGLQSLAAGLTPLEPELASEVLQGNIGEPQQTLGGATVSPMATIGKHAQKALGSATAAPSPVR